MSDKVKSHVLRNTEKDELLKQLDAYKTELAELRVAQITGGPASKVSKIKTVRKNIARVLTVLNGKQKASLRALYKTKKFAPRDLRVKKTRAKRRALSHDESSRKTLRQQKKEAAFPMRKFALAL
eukprot:TRINITY_DN3809_c2_g1_i2.p1 TRINITY_DN3809_c2_g1~~TRINITY_DN3809_c2_g1_i2.p1  ORF type:complete len:125 (+),score=34.30 TRINITY_DN3809_c2_g1_i2:51-425(+)